MKIHRFITAIFILITLLTFGKDNNPDPKLILQITIDQLRGDMPFSVQDRWTDGGFRYLYEQGVVHENAHHRHANTETIVGHSTLATGADPVEHGMIGTVWYDRALKRIVYCVEDSNCELVGEGGAVDKSAEVDKSQRIAGVNGRSAAKIMVTTFSDELAKSTYHKSKIFGVSVKDRGAVTMAGHAGKAFWFSKSKGEFISSTYYYDEYPKWVTDWNNKKLYRNYAGTNWELANDKSTYTYGDFDDMPYEISFAAFDRVFPHPYGKADDKYYTTLLTLSPAGDDLTLKFAKELIVQEEIGKDEIVDYLSISFSSTDYIGHVFGPTSLEGEDNLLKIDLMLEDLFSFVDEQVGLENTLIVFSADHGVSNAPPQLKEFGIDAGYINAESLKEVMALKVVKERYGITERLLEGFYAPNIYLNLETIDKYNLNKDEIAREIAKEIVKFDGIYDAIASCNIEEGKIPDTKIHQQIVRNYNPERSGEIYVVFKPNWFPNDEDGLQMASSHGPPWHYNTFVPLVFAGNDLQSQKIYSEVQTVDIALTLSKYLGIDGPSGASGKPLLEVLEK